jgi:hypothetical protein
MKSHEAASLNSRRSCLSPGKRADLMARLAYFVQTPSSVNMPNLACEAFIVALYLMKTPIYVLRILYQRMVVFCL